MFISKFKNYFIKNTFSFVHLVKKNNLSVPTIKGIIRKKIRKIQLTNAFKRVQYSGSAEAA
jgi:hypothetical protein